MYLFRSDWLKDFLLNRIFKNRILFILIFSLILQMFSLNWGLVTENPGLYGLAAFHMDEPGIASIPVKMILNNDLNPHWFIQPSGYEYVMLIPLYIINLFFSDHSILNAMLIGRSISIIFNILTIFIVYKIGKEFYNEFLGLVAALLLSINPYYLWFSAFVKQDSMAIFFVMLSFYFFIKYIYYEKIKFYYFSMFIAGMAASTKYVAGLVLVTIITIFIIKNYKFLNLIDDLKKINISLISYIVGFFLLTPYFILSTNEFLGGALGELNHYSNGHEGIGYQPFYTHVKTLLGLDDNNVLGLGLSPVFILIGLLFLIKDIGKMNKKMFWTNSLLFYWIILIFFTFSFIIEVKMQNQMLMAMPAAMIIAAYGIQRFITTKGCKLLKITLVLILLSLIFTYSSSVIVSRQNDNRYYVAHWLIENIKNNESIAVTPYVYVPSLFTNVTVIDPQNANLNWLRNVEFNYLILSSNTYDRYFYFKDLSPEKYDFYNILIYNNQESNYDIVQKFAVTETNLERTVTFGIRPFFIKEYHGEVEIYILKKRKN